jgi:hypothetical protein
MWGRMEFFQGWLALIFLKGCEGTSSGERRKNHTFKYDRSLSLAFSLD